MHLHKIALWPKLAPLFHCTYSKLQDFQCLANTWSEILKSIATKDFYHRTLLYILCIGSELHLIIERWNSFPALVFTSAVCCPTAFSLVSKKIDLSPWQTATNGGSKPQSAQYSLLLFLCVSGVSCNAFITTSCAVLLTVEMVPPDTEVQHSGKQCKLGPQCHLWAIL